MDHSYIQNDVDNIGDSSHEVVDELVEMIDQVAPASLIVPSYSPTKWDFLNNILDRVDVITKGRAGSLMMFATFLIIGGFTSLINIGIAMVVWDLFLPTSNALTNLVGTVVGIEISLVVNFIFNDKFTFNNAPGHDRPWIVRFFRFHATGLVGVLLTISLQSVFVDFLNLNKTIALAISIIIVLFYNFTFHQIFTYRRVKTTDKIAEEVVEVA
jgi:putative flippase GtrA